MSSFIDTSELDAFANDLLSMAAEKLPKESKKFLKTEAGKLSVVQKGVFKSFGIGETGVTEAEILKSIKPGKTYKRQGELHCRAYCSHPLGHLFDAGFIHKGGFKIKNGEEHFVKGRHFMEKAERIFEPAYYQNTNNFIDKMLAEGGL